MFLKNIGNESKKEEAVLIHIFAQILLRSGLNAKAVSIHKLPAEALVEGNSSKGDMVHSLKNNSWEEPCLWNSDCQNGGTCEDQGEFKLCKCKPGVFGGRCHVVEDCHYKYSNCKKERGTCSYDVEKRKLYAHALTIKYCIRMKIFAKVWIFKF
ncbi:hypothetical protein CEXT_726471 [Caerostris extrusa]|uniref:EGF-like domain-containing protein n=1 Tax=Caerostris extrusa TaxID=172846 RepID=A0AAV4RHT2_CAEEX|nr:hypothetical protein CEXT_726471 [Caerostris extrusa]